MSRNIDNKNLLGRNIINKGIGNVVKDINNIKTKYDFNADIGLGNLLIGNDSNGYTSNTLTAGTNVSITNTSGNITIASTDTDTNFFEKTNNDIRAENTTDNLLLGTTSNTNNRKLNVSGSIEATTIYAYSFITTVGLIDSSLNSVLSIASVGIYQINSSSANRVVKIQNGAYNHEFPSVSANDTFVLANAEQTLTNKQINKITNSNDRVIYDYNSTFSRLFLGNTTDNIQMFNAFLVSPKIEDASLNNFYNIVASELSANIDITLPVLSSNDEFVFKNATQTLTNKSISYSQITGSPVIPSNNNQLTNGAGYITASSTDDLSNKTLVAPFLDTFRNSNNRFTISYSNTTNSLTFGNSTDTSSAINFTLSSPVINTEVSGTAILDEDDLVSNSATKLATQQSIKSYVDTLKTKYDFSTTVSNGKLLIGNSAGNYSVNNLSAGTGISITNTSGNISIANTITNNNQLSNGAGYITSSDLINPILTTPKINDTSSNHTYNFTVSELLANREINLPLLVSNDIFVFQDHAQELKNKGLFDPIMTGLTAGQHNPRMRIHDANLTHFYNIKTGDLTASHDIYLPTITGTDVNTFVLNFAPQTLYNKTLTLPKINDTSSNHTYNFTVSEIVGNREINLPLLQSNDVFVFASHQQTLQNKTLSGGSILAATISGSTINNDINGNATTATNINGITTANIVQLTSTQTLTNKTISNALLTGSSSAIVRLHDASLNNSYTIKTEELSLNRTLTIPTISNDTGKFVIDNLAQTLTNKTLTTPTISSIANNTFGIDVSSPRTTLDLARNYPNDTSSTSGEATNIFLNTINTSGDSSGIVWKPNFSGYSKTSAFINFIPSGNFFRGYLEFGANNISDNSSAARKVMEIRDSGQYLFGNPITWSPEVIGNNWHPLCYWDGNAGQFGSAIGGTNTLNTGGNFRKYVWSIESSANSFRALGLAANNTDSITDTTGTSFTSIGWFNPTSKSTQFSFTASHRCYSSNSDLYNDDKIGMIVVSTGKYDSLYSDNISVENAVPIVELCNKKKCKSVLGVIGNYETDDEKRVGFDFGWIPVYEKDKNRLYINSIGEGGIWVCNTNGNFENGDYIQSSSVAGYGELQDDDILHNYSVAKITMDIDFDNIPEGFEKRTLENNVIAVFVGSIYQQG